MRVTEPRVGLFFWSRVICGDIDSCWPWISTKDRDGYGDFKTDQGGRRFRLKAHRVAWLLTYGSLPAAGLCVLHRCDNRSCCNPLHLFVGTHSDNMRDMVGKGRQVSHLGSRNGWARLTEEKVRTIRNLRAAGIPASQVAAEFGISPSHVYHLSAARPKAWAHVLSEGAN